MGITKAAIDKFQYVHRLKEKSEKTTWFDFAIRIVQRTYIYKIFPNARHVRVNFDIVEANTDTTKEVNAAMQVKKFGKDIDKDDSWNWIPLKT